MKPIKQNILRVFGRDPETLDELAECVIAVIDSQPNQGWGEKKRKTTANHRVAGFAWAITYTDRVSNSHSSPEGLPQNFTGREGVPRHYPGFEGRVWIRYAEEPNTWGSEPFEKTLTHTGTGGAGSYNGNPWHEISSARWQTYGHRQGAGMYPEIHCYSWDYRLYLADWPGIADWVEKQQLWSELSRKPWQRSHSFTWTDDEVLAADREFIRNGAVVVNGELV
jgi:hypothetical protein